MNYSDTKLIQIYSIAKTFLIKEMNCDNAENILQEYLNMPDKSCQPVDISEIYSRILASAQNANSKANVIGGAIGGIRNLDTVLFDFSPEKTLAYYEKNADKLLDDIVKKLNPVGKINREPKGLWVRYCQTILSAAEFLVQFQDGKDFYDWANHFYQDNKSVAALPLILEQEIYGIGYALACDFLKELGFVNYGKPDVHIKDIFSAIGLCDVKAKDYAIQKVIVRIAKANQISAYNVDKVFWLIGSGNFENHNWKIGSRKAVFIEFANHELKINAFQAA